MLHNATCIPCLQELSSSSLSTSSRGSFLSRNAATLDRLAAMTRARGEVRAGSGATKNTRNFVFSAVDNGGGKEETVEEDAQVQGNPESYKICSCNGR